jgi:hypothetical protein
MLLPSTNGLSSCASGSSGCAGLKLLAAAAAASAATSVKVLLLLLTSCSSGGSVINADSGWPAKLLLLLLK